jgi:hypothetical protein
MKFNIYLNNIYYKFLDLGEVEKYNPKVITDIVFADKEAGIIPEKFNVGEGMSIRIEKVE